MPDIIPVVALMEANSVLDKELKDYIESRLTPTVRKALRILIGSEEPDTLIKTVWTMEFYRSRVISNQMQRWGVSQRLADEMAGVKSRERGKE